MNTLDVVIGILCIMAIMRGYHRGFVLQLTNFIGLLLALYVAFRFSDDIGNALKEMLPFSVESMGSSTWLSFLPIDDVLYRLIAFIVIFIIVRFIVRRLGGLLNTVVKLPVLNSLNRLAGVVVAAVQALVFVLIVVNLLQLLPGPKMQTLLNESWIAVHLLNVTPNLTDLIGEWMSTADK